MCRKPLLNQILFLSPPLPPVHRRAAPAAAVPGGVPGGHAVAQREALAGPRRHAVHRGGHAHHGRHPRRAGGARGHLLRPHPGGQLQQRAAGRAGDIGSTGGS